MKLDLESAKGERREAKPMRWNLPTEPQLRPASAGPDDTTELQQLVRRHQLYWEVWPEYLSFEGRPRQVGFRLGLLGTHDHPAHPPVPGCEECQKVYRDLVRVGRWILPKAQRDSVYRILPFEAAIAYPPHGGSRQDVVLSIRIVHRTGFDLPVDACEAACLAEMKDRLRQLGAQDGSWREPVASTAVPTAEGQV